LIIRKILAPVRGDGNGKYVVDQAIAIARQSNAHVDVVYIKKGLEAPPPYGIPLSPSMRSGIMEAIATRESSEIEMVKSHYDRLCEQYHLLQSDGSPGPEKQVTISWSAHVGRQSKMVAKLGKFSDLIVIPRPDPVNRIGINTLEESLFHTGKPVLVVPRKLTQTLGKHIGIAWNASDASSTALTLALSLISTADKVTILTAGTTDNNRQQASLLADYLKWHEVDASIRLFKSDKRRIGTRLMAEASDCGADMLVLGAYGHNRHKEILLGGVTEHIIWNLELPILMAG